MPGTPLYKTNPAGRWQPPPYSRQHTYCLPLLLNRRAAAKPTPYNTTPATQTTASVSRPLLYIKLQQCTWHQSYSTAAVKGDNTTDNSRKHATAADCSTSASEAAMHLCCFTAAVKCNRNLQTAVNRLLPPAATRPPCPSNAQQQRSTTCDSSLKHEHGTANNKPTPHQAPEEPQRDSAA